MPGRTTVVVYLNFKSIIVKTLDAIAAFQAVQKLIDNPTAKSVAFSYALARNKRLLEPIVVQYNATLTAQRDPDLDTLLTLWRDIAAQYAALDDEQHPKRDASDNIIIDPKRLIDYNIACEQVMNTDADYTSAYRRRTGLVNELQAVEVDIEVYPIALALFPPDTDFTTINLLYPLIGE